MAHGFQSMVDMARSPTEIKKDIPQPTPPSDISGPEYPYGLCLSLGEDELEKLDLDDEMPDVGDMIHLCAMAKVTAVSESESVNAKGEKTRRCRVELQVTHLATENEDDEAPGMSREHRMKHRYMREEADAD